MIDPMDEAMPEGSMAVRLEALERENRRIKWALAAAFVVAVVVASRGGDLLKRRSKVVEAEGFLLVDRQGQPRARLGFNVEGQPELALFDRKGRDQVALEAQDDNSAALAFYNKEQTRIYLSSSDDGTASLRFIGADPTAQAAMFLWPDSTTGLAMNQGPMGIVMSVQPDGLTGLAVHDREGLESGRLGSLPPGVNCLGLTRADGKAPFRVGPAPTPTPPAVTSTLASPMLGSAEPEAPTEADGGRELDWPSGEADSMLAEDALETFIADPVRPALRS